MFSKKQGLEGQGCATRDGLISADFLKCSFLLFGVFCRFLILGFAKCNSLRVHVRMHVDILLGALVCARCTESASVSNNAGPMLGASCRGAAKGAQFFKDL